MRSAQTKYKYKVLYADGVEIYRHPYATRNDIEDADMYISNIRYNARYTEDLADAKFTERIEYR